MKTKMNYSKHQQEIFTEYLEETNHNNYGTSKNMISLIVLIPNRNQYGVPIIPEIHEQWTAEISHMMRDVFQKVTYSDPIDLFQDCNRQIVAQQTICLLGLGLRQNVKIQEVQAIIARIHEFAAQNVLNPAYLYRLRYVD
ncbi:hypothetical protein H9Q08_17430 [Chryseobacterium sp. PS-8]|uniref:Uncharacterized protein n=1 Tax=Chryseobacterium indicum TaxID=2766954 RepID=A0ABS9CCH5_9FLAO|nr:hypothetical protein [Chryseobacterium sp. PS-8]MCF2221071.1 hypothetical protein [Chryseobacterium sp. PS-8]